jgi:hypothetical protein
VAVLPSHRLRMRRSASAYDQAVILCQGGLHAIQEIKGGMKAGKVKSTAAVSWVGPWAPGHVIHDEAAAGRAVWTVGGQELYARKEAASGNYRYASTCLYTHSASTCIYIVPSLAYIHIVSHVALPPH